MCVLQVTNNGHSGRGDVKVPSEDDPLESGPSGLSISLGSLDLDFSTPSFGLGTITEGRSLMNIPVTANSSGTSMSGDNPVAGKQHAGIQRSISQQPLPSSDAASRARDLPRQPAPPKAAPATQPKPRRGWFKKSSPPTSRKPSVTNQQRPVITVVRQGSVTSMGSQQPPQKDTIVDKKSSPSPPQGRRDASPTQPKASKVMTQVLPVQTQQELAARQLKQAGKAPLFPPAKQYPIMQGSNGAAPQLQSGSTKQRSPASPRRAPQPPPKPLPAVPTSSKPPVPTARTSPQQRVSPTSVRLHGLLATPPELRGSSSLNRLGPGKGIAEDTLSSISRNSSIDSGIQFASEGENGGGGGGGGGGGVHSESSAAGSSLAGVHSESSAAGSSLAGVKEGGSAADSDGLGFGDFASDIFSALASKSWMQS